MTNLIGTQVRMKTKIGFKKTIIQNTVNTLGRESNNRLTKYLGRHMEGRSSKLNGTIKVFGQMEK